LNHFSILAKYRWGKAFCFPSSLATSTVSPAGRVLPGMHHGGTGDQVNGNNGQPEHQSFGGRTLLITGGTGYLASAVVALLKDIDCRIIRWRRQGACPKPVTGTAKVTEIAGDVRDPGVWEKNLAGVDYIFHLAAQTSTYTANENPLADQAVNVLPMLHLLEACRRLVIRPTICFASTVTIAGIPERLPVDESHADHPLTIYDLHKLMAEQYLHWYAEQGLVQGVTLRFTNVYGPGPRSSRADRGILNQMIRRALAGETLSVYGAGDQVRDYLYVEDAARAFLAATLHSKALNGKYFIIGSGRSHTIAEAMGMVADRAAAKTGRPVQVQHVAPPGGLSPIEQRHFVADSRRFCKATRWQARHTLAQGIDLTLEAFS
jgi:UDP-glucose 4-epimerase